jgi:aspartate aminotransferase-like enzyme
VDAVGSFLADPVGMAASAIDALIFSSQKALALPPGLSFVALGVRAQQRVRATPARSFYFDFRKYLDDIPRGQTPFTPAVGLIRQLEGRLERILANGVEAHVERVRSRALDFRAKIRGLPFRILAESPSNAVTALEPADGVKPGLYVSALADHYGMFVCPNGGQLRDRIFRVGHLGDLSPADNTQLAGAMREIVDRLGA